jgi:hypothetical protein
VLEHFHQSFPETGGRILYKDLNRRNAKLSNLDFIPFEEPGCKLFWDVYYKTRWDRDDIPEEHVKAYFDHLLDKGSVANFCEKYNAGFIPQDKELRLILEAGWVEKYGARRHSHRSIPEGQVRQLLKYLVGRATILSDESPNEAVLNTKEEVQLTRDPDVEEDKSQDKICSNVDGLQGMNAAANPYQSSQLKQRTTIYPIQIWKVLEEHKLTRKVEELVEKFKMNYFLINNINGKKRQLSWEDRNDHIMQSWHEAAQDEVYFEFMDKNHKKQRTDLK